MGTLLLLFHLPTVKEHMILGYQAIAVGNKTSKPPFFFVFDGRRFRTFEERKKKKKDDKILYVIAVLQPQDHILLV